MEIVGLLAARRELNAANRDKAILRDGIEAAIALMDDDDLDMEVLYMLLDNLLKAVK